MVTITWLSRVNIRAEPFCTTSRLSTYLKLDIHEENYSQQVSACPKPNIKTKEHRTPPKAPLFQPKLPPQTSSTSSSDSQQHTAPPYLPQCRVPWPRVLPSTFSKVWISPHHFIGSLTRYRLDSRTSCPLVLRCRRPFQILCGFSKVEEQ
jgi:hypothetical protein